MSAPRMGLPRCEDAERGLLGIVLREGSLINLMDIEASDFYSERHRSIYSAMLRLASEKVHIDLVTLREALMRSRELEMSGGDVYMMDLADCVVSAAGWESYQELVRDYSLKRQCIAIARRMNEEAFEGDGSGAEMVAEMQAALNTVSTGRKDEVRSLQVVAAEFFAALNSGASAGCITTGFKALDEILTIKPFQLGVVGARPGCGKTSFAVQVGLHVGRMYGEVLFNSLEMGDVELVGRMMSQVAGIPVKAIESGYFTPRTQGMSMANLPHTTSLGFCYAPTIEGLRAIALRRKAYGNLRLVVVDYLQLMGPAKPTGSETTDLTMVTRGLKLLAKELQVPVLALSQYSRDAAKASRPKLHNLRGSGSIEQDADWVLALYDDEESNEFDLTPDYKLWELQKQRGGAISNPFRMRWSGRTTSFSDYAE